MQSFFLLDYVTILLFNLDMLLTGNLCAANSGIYRRERLSIKSGRNWLGKFAACYIHLKESLW